MYKISPTFYKANPNPKPTGPTTPQYGNYPPIWSGEVFDKKLVKVLGKPALQEAGQPS